jgi:hypothetical protein
MKLIRVVSVELLHVVVAAIVVTPARGVHSFCMWPPWTSYMPRGRWGRGSHVARETWRSCAWSRRSKVDRERWRSDGLDREVELLGVVTSARGGPRKNTDWGPII